MPSISLVSINIERDRHLDALADFFRMTDFDAVALQEVLEKDVPFFERILGMEAFFTPVCVRVDRPGMPPSIEGQALFAKHIELRNAEFYAGEYDTLWRHFSDTDIESIENVAKAISYVDVNKNGCLFRVGTTHFTWSVKGATSETQRKDIKRLVGKLETLGEFALVGDFNAPRGGEIFTELALKYKDNIPETYEWSLDTSIHYAGRDRLEKDANALGLKGLMVDGLFTTPGYLAKNVQLHAGVSDHCAIAATISKL